MLVLVPVVSLLLLPVRTRSKQEGEEREGGGKDREFCRMEESDCVDEVPVLAVVQCELWKSPARGEMRRGAAVVTGHKQQAAAVSEYFACGQEPEHSECAGDGYVSVSGVHRCRM